MQICNFVLFVTLLIFIKKIDITYGQAACQCGEMNRCLQEYDQQLLTAAANCRSQCQTMLGPNYATAAIQCFAEKESQLIQSKTVLRTCFEARAGQPCVTPQSTPAPATGGGAGRKKRAVPAPGLPPVIVLPPNVRNFILCYATCQRNAFMLQVEHSQGRGGIWGYPGCARMLNCVLVRPQNFTAGLAAHVDCSIQVGAQTQLVFQTFCGCLKSAMGTDSQFLNCDVYGSPVAPAANNTAPTGTTEAPSEFSLFNF